MEISWRERKVMRTLLDKDTLGRVEEGREGVGKKGGKTPFGGFSGVRKKLHSIQSREVQIEGINILC